MTIGNLPKHIRRKPSRQGQTLLAYLPTSKLKHITNKAARRRAVANLFHACMGFLLKPLEKLGLSGLPMTSGDGAVRDCHPLFATHVGDYPEQILVTCLKNGECPECPVPCDKLGHPNCVCQPCEMGPILDALEAAEEGLAAFTQACKAAGIKPVQRLFWRNLPFVNIFRSITPDVLHQLYQGNIKHLIGWIKNACGEAEIDAHCRRLPPNHNIRLFLKGISHLSRVSGTEHDQICRFLLGITIDISLPRGLSSSRLIRATRGMLDFLYITQYPIHTRETLDLLDEALQMYHNNRDIFIDLGIRTDFNFPKDHFNNHYRELIELYGTADNFNTEYTERLHIDLAKDAFRATNSKDEYPQMTLWLERRESVLLHDKFIARQLAHRLSQLPADDGETPASVMQIVSPAKIPPLLYPRQLKMSTRPSVYGVSLDEIKTLYHADDFEGALAHFVIHVRHPDLSRREVELQALDLYLPFQKISVFHRIKFVSNDPFSYDPTADIVVDSIHCEPMRRNTSGKIVPGRFDTAVVNHKDGGRVGVKGLFQP